MRRRLNRLRSPALRSSKVSRALIGMIVDSVSEVLTLKAREIDNVAPKGSGPGIAACARSCKNQSRLTSRPGII